MVQSAVVERGSGERGSGAVCVWEFVCSESGSGAVCVAKELCYR